MTDITATGLVADRQAQERSQKRAKRSRGLSIGAVVGSMARAVGDVFALAYVAPYQGSGPTPQPVAAEGEDGRDPSW